MAPATSAPALKLPAIVRTVELPRLNGHGSEVWAARTQDGVWEFDRTEDRGTPWEVRHIPSVTDGSWPGPVSICGTLRACRALVSSGGAEQELAWRKEGR